MIVTESEAESSPKTPRPSELPSAASGSSQRVEEQLPAYGAPRPVPSPRSPLVSPHAVLYPHPVVLYGFIPPQKSVKKRFFSALFVAIVIYILCTVFMRSLISLVNWRPHIIFGDYDIPSDIRVDYCISGNEWPDLPRINSAEDSPINHLYSSLDYPYSSKATFQLPLSSDVLFLLSRGAYSGGDVRVVTSHVERDFVEVIVVMKYLHDYHRDFAKVCNVRRDKGVNGVGIFSRQRQGWDGVNIMHFETHVVLPSGNSSNRLFIKKFETDMPQTYHQVDDLESRVEFSSISLKASNAPIIVKTLYAHEADIRTSNGAIRGVFNASNALSLRTSNGLIKVDVGLDIQHRNDIPRLSMQTSNSPLESDISLISNYKNGGTYNINGSTSNGNLKMRIVSSPLDSILQLKARTSNSAATVSLNPAYEGTFSLSTSNFLPVVRQLHRDVEDPSGKGRTRKVHYRNANSKRMVSGDVHWSNEEKQAGTVDLHTSNGLVTLEL